MSRVYAVTFQAVAVTAAQDLFEITPADDKPVRFLGWHLSQYTDVGDAQDEVLRLAVIRGFTASGSGGSAATPAPLNPNAAAAGFTAEVNNTTLANTGTTATLYAGGFNVRAGDPKDYQPELRPVATQANTTMVLRLVSAPADSLTMDGCLFVEEMA